jgi:hypothetical protein
LGEGGDGAPKRPGEGGGLSRANANRDESALLVVDVGKNILIMNNPDLILRSELTNASKK